MITWNHRVVKNKYGTLYIAEVEYENKKEDKIISISDPIEIKGYESIAQLKFELDLLIDATNKPVITSEEIK